MASNLIVKIKGNVVDAVSARVNFRTINQGHMMFATLLDNINGQYSGAFDANDPVEIYLNGVLIFKGVIDTAKHALDQGRKWNFTDYLRVAGRDLSIELSNLKYSYLFPSTMQFDDMIANAFTNTGCTIGFTGSATPTIGGHTSEDEYLLDLVREVIQRAGYEGYVDLSKELQYFVIGDITKVTGVGIGDLNCLGTPEYTEIEGRDIRNHIIVFGEDKQTLPTDQDTWTDWVVPGDHNWVSDSGSGTISRDTDQKMKGDESVKHSMTVAGIQNVFHFNYYAEYGAYIDALWKYKELEVWVRCDEDCTGVTHATWIRLIDKDGYYQDYTINHSPPANTWIHHVLPLGVTHLGWSGQAAFDWTKVAQIKFYFYHASTTSDAWVDWLFFGKRRWEYTVQDATSQTAYGKRELTKITDAISTAECQKHAEELLAEMKDPLQSIRAIVPVSTFIVDSAWKGLVGHRITFYGTTYRIIDLTVDIVPYQNLNNGYDAIATVNMVPLTAKLEPDVYDSIVNPKVSSLLRRFRLKTGF